MADLAFEMSNLAQPVSQSVTLETFICSCSAEEQIFQGFVPGFLSFQCFKNFLYSQSDRGPGIGHLCNFEI